MFVLFSIEIKLMKYLSFNTITIKKAESFGRTSINFFWDGLVWSNDWSENRFLGAVRVKKRTD